MSLEKKKEELFGDFQVEEDEDLWKKRKIILQALDDVLEDCFYSISLFEKFYKEKEKEWGPGKMKEVIQFLGAIDIAMAGVEEQRLKDKIDIIHKYLDPKKSLKY